MKFISILTLLFSTLFFSYARGAEELVERANWSGGYGGKIKVTNESGQTFDCNEFLVIAHNIQEGWEGFWAYSGFPTCGIPSILTASAIYEIKRNRVLFFGVDLGEFDGTALDIVKSGSGIKEELRLERKNESELFFYKKVLFADGDGFFEMSGTLYRQ